MRANSSDPEQGGVKKSRELHSKRWLEEAREEWADMQNSWLAGYGHDARVDHRSLSDQGIERPAQIHEEPTARAMEKKGIKTERGDLNRGRIQGAERYKELEHDFMLCSAAIEAEELEIAVSGQLGELNSESRKMSETGLKPRAEKASKTAGSITPFARGEEEREEVERASAMQLATDHYFEQIMNDKAFKMWNPERREDGTIRLGNRAGQVLDKGEKIDIHSSGKAKGDNPHYPTAATA